MEKSYKPSEEEIKKAEGIMTDEERALSEEREKSYKESKETIKPEMLIIDDMWLYEAMDSLDENGKGHYSLDLQGALDYLTKNNPSIILTDMCFPERGVYSDKGQKFEEQRKDKKFEKIVEETMKRSNVDEEAKHEGIYHTNSYTSPKYIDEFEKEILNEGPLKITIEEYKKHYEEHAEFLRKTKQDIKPFDQESEFKRMLEMRLRGGCPLGILIAEEAEKRKIPYVIVTSIDHGQEILPILSARKIIDRNELETMAEDASFGMLAKSKNGKVIIVYQEKSSSVWHSAYRKVIDQIKK